MTNGNTRWIVGIAITVVLAMAGWGTTAVLAAKNVEFGRMDNDVTGLQVYAVSNDKRITRLEANYETILSTLGEIKQSVKDIKR